MATKEEAQAAVIRTINAFEASLYSFLEDANEEEFQHTINKLDALTEEINSFTQEESFTNSQTPS